jgi:hypothetical protein
MQWNFSVNNFGVSPEDFSVWEVVLPFSHRRWKNKHTDTHTQNPKFKCNTVSVSPSASSPSSVVSSKETKKNTGSLETALWMSIWGCGSPASYCQPSAAAGFVYLEFYWRHAPFVFSNTQPYGPFAVPVVFI